jgi:hypothetical protein
MITEPQPAKKHLNRPVRAKQQAFLAAYAEQGTLTGAAAAAGVSRHAVYRWMAIDGDFASKWKDAREEFADRLEAEARRRAVEGVEEYVVSSGKLVYGPDGQPLKQRRFSDHLLALMLKAKRGEEYRERSSIEHSGPGGGPLRTQASVSHHEVTADEVRDAVRALVESSRGEGASDRAEPLHPEEAES